MVAYSYRAYNTIIASKISKIRPAVIKLNVLRIEGFAMMKKAVERTV